MEKIVSNLKGIKELWINDKDKKNLDERIHAIYGANGSGKSSLKNAISGIYKKNWSIGEDKKCSISKKIESKNKDNLAIFDERIVSLITKNLKSNVKLFGQKANSLFELLVNRKNVLSNHNKREIIEDVLFKINTKNFFDKIKTIKDIEKIIEKLEWKNDIDYEINNKIMDLIIEKLNKIFYSDFFENEFRFIEEKDKLGKINYYFPFIKRNKLEKIKKLLVYSKNNIFKPKNNNENINNIIEGSKNELTSLKSFFENLYFVIENFGYIKLNKNKNKLDEFNQFLKDSKVFHIDALNENARYINQIIEVFRDKKDECQEIVDIWDEIHKKVLRVQKISNILLNVYNLDYKVEWIKTDIEELKKWNFSLSHIHSKKKLTESEIVESVSYGELNIISLCIFLSACLVRKINEDAHFIFDDPISSYDLNRVQTTINIINNIIVENKNVKKIHFLSHEKHFLKNLNYTFNRNNEKQLMFWHLVKNKDSSELKHVEKIEGDFEFYIKMQNSKNKITNFVAKRIVLEIEKFIMENKRKINEKNKDELKDELKDKLKDELKNELTKEIQELNKKIYDEENHKENDLFKKNNIIKDDLFALKFFLKVKSKDFWNKWLKDQSKKIIKKIENEEEIDEEEMKILKTSLYKSALTTINHSNKGEVYSLDISRVSEMIDIMFSNASEIINNFKDCFEIYKKENEGKIIELMEA